MKYPYIGKWEKINTTVIFTDKNAGIEVGGEMKYRNDWTEMFYENITAEYLANTYGEVKSKEHAEFIVKLAENHGAICPTDINYNKCKFFYFSPVGGLFFTKEKVSDLATECKRITIPLPPECESVDEWPKVGDDAVVINKNDYTLIYGHEVVGENVKVLTTYSTNDISMAVVEFDGCGYCFRVDMLEKPKTPEQELEYDLTDLIMRARDADVDDVTIARSILSKYNITKKPQ